MVTKMILHASNILPCNRTILLKLLTVIHSPQYYDKQ